MEEKERLPNKRIFYGTQVKVFGTDPKNPEDGRITYGQKWVGLNVPKRNQAM